MTDTINMNDLPLESHSGRWIILTGTQRKRISTDINTFRVKIKAATMNLEDCKKNFELDSRMVRKAQRNYDFLFNQIDQLRSDTFALQLYNTTDWTL